MGRRLITEILGQADSVGAKSPILKSIFACSASAVAPSKKVKLTLDVHYVLSTEPKMNIVR